jgi:putative membrane protein
MLFSDISRYCGTPYGRKAIRANFGPMKKKRLTPFSGSLFRLALALIGGVAVLAVAFTIVDQAPLRKSTGSFDTSTTPLGGLSRGDQRFLEHASALNVDQIQLSELATRQAADERVRHYADQMLIEFRRTGMQIATLANRRSAALLEPHDRGAAWNLARETPKNFDDAYLVRMVDAHAEAMDLFERAATQCDDPELRAFAVKAVPGLQALHARAKALRKVVG